MEDLPEKIKQARSAGYGDDEIIGFLAQQPAVGEKVKTALEAGYKPAEVLGFLSQSDAYREGRKVSPVRQAANRALNSASFGFFDEVAGAISAPVKTLQNGKSLAQNYRDGRDYVRGSMDKFEEDHPWGAVGVDVGAGAAAALAAGPLKLAETGLRQVAPRAVSAYKGWVAPAGQVTSKLAPRVVSGAVNGAAYGALSGAGNSKSEDVGGMFMDSLKSAATGSALGAATPVVGAVVRPMARNAGSLVSSKVRRDYAAEKVAEAMVRDAPEVADFGLAGRGASRLQQLGPEARVVDTAGQNTYDLLDTLSTLPGASKNQVKQAIEERVVGRADRLRGAASDALNVNGTRAPDSIAAWSSQRKLKAAPLYNRLHRVEIQPDDNIIGLVAAADQLGALKVARKIATAERSPFTLALTDDGMPLRWSMRDLDRVKQGLDTKIAKTWNEQTGSYTPEGQSLINLKAQLVQALDAATTGKSGKSLYRAAREAYAGPSALIDAANLGRKVWTKDDASIRDMMEGFGASELQAFRIGAYEALRGKLGKMAGQTEILNLYRDKTTAEKLQALFGSPQAFQKFAEKAAGERGMKALERVGAGSQTASRLYGAGDLDISPIETAASVAGAVKTGSLQSMFGPLARAWNNVKTPEVVRDEMGRILLSRDPREFDRLETIIPMINAARARNAAAAGRFSGLAGGLLTQ